MALTSLTNLQPLHVHSVGISTFDGSVSVGGTLTYEDVTNVDAIGIITARSGVNVSGGQLDVGSNIKIGNAGVITATSFVGSGANLTSLPAANITGTLPAISGANLTNIPAGNLTGTVADARISTLTASKLTGALPAISGANLTNLPVQASISSNANNRVITGGGGSNLVGEENLNFDGAHLILGNGKGIRSNYIRPTDMSNTNTGGTSQQYWKIGDISLNGSEAAEITLLGSSGYSSGNAQYYGKTTIVLRGSNGNTLLGSWWVDGGESSHYSDVRWKYTSGTTYELWISSGAYNNIAPFVKTTGTFDNSNAAGTGTNNPPSGSTALQQTHYKSIGTIHTIQYTSTHTRFLQNIKMDNGKGIDFSSASGSASGSSSAVLDDYEEGSFTAILRSNSNPSNTGENYDTSSNFTSYYTKIGNIVYVSISMSNLHTSPDLRNHQLIRVEGLPFTTARRCGINVVDGRGIYPRWSTDSQTTNAATTTVWADGNDTKFYLQFYMHYTPYTAWATVHNSTSSQRWHIAGCYPVA